jgi:ring-1,2-phenylacetyl-CoA epoxidase subunit PaaD
MVIEKEEILNLLKEVKDPEIPVLSLVDLGVITDIEIKEDNVVVHMTPTFIGCPAIEYMQTDIKEILEKNGFDNVEVEVSFDIQWNSNMISREGREALKKFGLAPPPKHDLIFDIDILNNVQCPNCDSNNTTLSTPFGPTLCRSIHYCNSCKQAFEQFKPL